MSKDHLNRHEADTEGTVIATILTGPQVDPMDVGNLVRALSRACEEIGLEPLRLRQDGEIILDLGAKQDP